MLDCLSYKQFVEWSEYLAMEPPTADRVDVMLSQLTAVVAECHRDSKARRQPFLPSEFFPNYGGREESPAKPRQTPEEAQAIWKMFVACHNAKNRKATNANRS